MDAVLFRLRIAAWYQASRPPFFIATLVPLVLGTVLSARSEPMDWLLWWLVVGSSFLVHLCTNLANDLFDYMSGADAGGSIGGSRVIQQGRISPSSLVRALLLLYGLAVCGGLYILLATQLWWLAGYMMFAFCSSLFYTAPPIRYGYRGLGELFVFLNMGPLMVSGAYAVQAGGLTTDILLLSIPTGLMVALILYYQSLPDIETDRSAGKCTISSLLSRSGAIFGFRLLAGLSLLSIVSLCVAGLLSIWGLACLLSLPLLVKIDSMLHSTSDWQELHGRGKFVRMFYLVNGIIVIFASRMAG
jgi:1,4-dihydroxy-2-naphthoate octaprenyltransferase